MISYFIFVFRGFSRKSHNRWRISLIYIHMHVSSVTASRHQSPLVPPPGRRLPVTQPATSCAAHGACATLPQPAASSPSARACGHRQPPCHGLPSSQSAAGCGRVQHAGWRAALPSCSCSCPCVRLRRSCVVQMLLVRVRCLVRSLALAYACHECLPSYALLSIALALLACLRAQLATVLPSHPLACASCRVAFRYPCRSCG